MACNYMKTLSISLILAVISSPVFSGEPYHITVNDRMQFEEGIKVPDEVRKDCDLETKLAGYVKKYLENAHFAVSTVPAIDNKLRGKFLDVKMIGVHADDFGSWETGGGSMVVIKAELKENGKKIDTFKFYRKSNRRFSSVCSLLHNCVNTLGKDITKWMVRINPPPVDKKTLTKSDSFEEEEF